MGYLPVVVDTEYLGGYKLKVAFDNGAVRIADCEPWLRDEVFEPPKDQAYFRRSFVDGWTVSWPNGADIAPETLYEDSEPA